MEVEENYRKPTQNYLRRFTIVNLYKPLKAIRFHFNLHGRMVGAERIG